MNRAGTLTAAVLVWLGGAALNGSVSSALNVFDDYKDSPDAVYLFLAVVWLLVAVGFAGIGGWLLIRGAPPPERGRRISAAAMLAVSGACLPAALGFGYELGDIANDPGTEPGNAAGAAASLVIGWLALAGGSWRLLAGDAAGRRRRRTVATAALVVACLGVAGVYVLIPPADEERLAGAVALVDNRTVGCTEQGDGWFYCRAAATGGRTAKDYVVTFDGTCWVTMTPKFRATEIAQLSEIQNGCLNKRGVGRTGPGPGGAPAELARAASRFLGERP